MKTIFERLKHAWNAFKSNDSGDYLFQNLGTSSSRSPVVSQHSMGFERSIIYAVCNRIAIDVSAYDIQHVRLDPVTGRYKETMKTGLNQCLTTEANIDQTGRAFLQDAVMSMFDEGFVALVPVETDFNPRLTNSYEINSLRTGKVVEWYPQHVRVELYNDRSGLREQLVLPKSIVAIVENPLYAVMNEPNSTLKRLLRKLILLDSVDEQVSSGKLDLIIQLPYVLKTALRNKQAEERRKAIETQLAGSKYGIAYIDGTEHVTQLNRPAENNLLAQIEYLTKMLYSQLGISQAVFDGTAKDVEMLNYYDRTIEPIATAFTDEMRRKFLTKTARSQGQTIMGFRDVFRLMPATEIADLSNSLIRNEILTANEVRAILGMKPAQDPAADELRNPNMPADEQGAVATEAAPAQEPGFPREQVQQMMDEMSQEYEDTINEILDEVKKNVEDLVDSDGDISKLTEIAEKGTAEAKEAGDTE